MPRLSRRWTVAFVVFALIASAAALWLILRRSRIASLNPTRPAVCEEWAKAEVAGQGLGWDLTYMSLLKRLKLCPGNIICDEWAKPEPPVNKLAAEWNKEDPIISSVEFELPDGHAGMVSIWLIRTKESAYHWGFSLGEDKAKEKQPIPVQAYDTLFEEMACWRQDEPPQKIFGEHGYLGFLSLYKEGKWRQLLITQNDIFIGDMDKMDEEGAGTPGRFSLALTQLLKVMEEEEKKGSAGEPTPSPQMSSSPPASNKR
ncbi:MAG TPA: hypothetical protein VJT09_01445 [Pyrinomonadaceae bacterium]|nr:hypothetical protein [Pyrinomonadaceae bacterium]